MNFTSRSFHFGLAIALVLSASAFFEIQSRAEAGEAQSGADSKEERYDRRWEELENKAESLFVEGKLEESRKAWDQARKFARDENLEREYATTLNQLNYLYLKTGQYEKAFTDLSEALALRKRLLGDESLLTAQTMGNLALACQKLGRHKQSESLYKESLAVKEKLLPEDSPQIALGMHNLAKLYGEEKRYRESLDLLDRASKIDAKNFGAEHVEVFHDLLAAGETCFKCREFEEANERFEKALALSKKLSFDKKSERASLLALHHYLGLTATKLEKHEKAREHLEKAYALCEEVHGKGHKEHTRALLNRAANADFLKDQKLALALLNQALKNEESRKPTDEYMLTDVLFTLGHYFKRHHDDDQATDYFKRALAHYDGLNSHGKRRLYDLPIAYSQLLKDGGKESEAEEISRKYLHVMSPHGEKHFKL